LRHPINPKDRNFLAVNLSVHFMMIEKAQQSGSHALERRFLAQPFHIPNGHDQVFPVFEIIPAGFARFERAHHVFDLSV